MEWVLWIATNHQNYLNESDRKFVSCIILERLSRLMFSGYAGILFFTTNVIQRIWVSPEFPDTSVPGRIFLAVQDN